MIPELYGCKSCGAPLKIVPGQFKVRCNYCRSLYYCNQEFPPALVLESQITLSQAKKVILRGLRDKRVDKGFRRNCYFEKGILYYIPFYEVRGIKFKKIRSDKSGGTDLSLSSFEYMERAADLNDAGIEFIDTSLVEKALLQSRQVSYNPVDMRKNGVVLEPRLAFRETVDSAQDLKKTIELHVRIVYFPVWEIRYSYRGIVFRSLCSAVDGRVIRIHALRNHRRKLSSAILGILALGILLARLMKAAVFFITVGKFSLFSLVSGVMLISAALFVWVLLFPYLWRLFAFREEVIFSGIIEYFNPINYQEPGLLRAGHGSAKKLLRRIFTGSKKNF